MQRLLGALHAASFIMAYDYRFRNFTFAAGGFADLQQLLMPDTRRISVYFTPTQGGLFHICARAPQSANDATIALNVNDFATVRWRDDGELVQREWWAFSDGAGALLSVTEVLYIPPGV
jgi:hypothetical protein